MAGELILIVEDNERNRKLVRDILQFKGYTTIETGNAEEAIRVAQESQPALILMDLQLPGMDGITALKHLRADVRTKDIPIIAVTASAMTHRREEILANGFDGYQTKPISVNEFLELVRRVLDQGRARGIS
jgi:two-component system cell cycle response regulator DivK